MKKRLRYRDEGELHLDFHRTTNGTIAHLRKRYGKAFLSEVLRRTAQDVYHSIWDDLKRGDTRQLKEHWQHYFSREGGRFTISEKGGCLCLKVTRCPAIAYLKKKRIPIDPDFCCQTSIMNEAWAEGSPFEISTKMLGFGKCIQTATPRQKVAATRKGSGRKA